MSETKKNSPIQPGAKLGVLGGGQLGRMFAQAAQRLGYAVHVYEPSGPGCPAAAACVEETNASYEDAAALAAFAKSVDVVTYEFENIPSGPLEAIASFAPLCPRPEVLHICQNRSREKAWLKAQGFPIARYAEVEAGGDLAAAVREVGLPCIVKTADFGYDGKGQLKLKEPGEVAAAVAAFAGKRCVVEQFVDFVCEVSAVVARRADGQAKVFPVAENIHTNHILDFSIVPARVAPEVEKQARELGLAVAERIGVVGLIAIEMFVGRDGRVLINELAPRPHNSGHYTMDACAVSQFEQHVRAICGLPLMEPTLRSPVVMVNILGDAWGKTRPNWDAILNAPDAHLHLYGKSEARAGRKMGHFNVLRTDVEVALRDARALKVALAGKLTAPVLPELTSAAACRSRR